MNQKNKNEINYAIIDCDTIDEVEVVEVVEEEETLTIEEQLALAMKITIWNKDCTINDRGESYVGTIDDFVVVLRKIMTEDGEIYEVWLLGNKQFLCRAKLHNWLYNNITWHDDKLNNYRKIQLILKKAKEISSTIDGSVNKKERQESLSKARELIAE